MICVLRFLTHTSRNVSQKWKQNKREISSAISHIGNYLFSSEIKHIPSCKLSNFFLLLFYFRSSGWSLEVTLWEKNILQSVTNSMTEFRFTIVHCYVSCEMARPWGPFLLNGFVVVVKVVCWKGGRGWKAHEFVCISVMN